MKRTVHLIVILVLILTAAPASAEVSTYAQAQKYILSMGYPGSEQRLLGLLDKAIGRSIALDIPYDYYCLAKSLCNFEARLVHSSSGGYKYITDGDMIDGAIIASLWTAAFNDDPDVAVTNLTTYVQETKLTIKKAAEIITYISDITNFLPSFVGDRCYKIERYLDYLGFDTASLAQLTALCLLRDVDPMRLVDYLDIYTRNRDFYAAQKNLKPLFYSIIQEPDIRKAEDILAAEVNMKPWDNLITDVAFGLNWPGSKPASVLSEIEKYITR